VTDVFQSSYPLLASFFRDQQTLQLSVRESMEKFSVNEKELILPYWKL